MASDKRNEQYRRCNEKVSVFYSINLNRRTNCALIEAIEAEKAAGRSIASAIKQAVNEYNGNGGYVAASERQPRIEKDYIFSVKLNRRTDAGIIDKIEAAKERGASAMGYIKLALMAYFGVEECPAAAGPDGEPAPVEKDAGMPGDA